MSGLRLDAERVIADLDELAAQSGGRFAGAKRLAWTPEWCEARGWLRSKLEAIGIAPEADAAGNLWAAVQGKSDRFLIVGSHLDAVPQGGWLDGALGVLAALEVIRQLAQHGTSLPIGVRLVDWADEEGARFGRSMLGSSACTGRLSPDLVRTLVDADATTLADGLAACGVDLDRAPCATASMKGAVAYLELHVEQGPVLLDSGRLASAVSGTFGVERHLMTFIGQAAHAGSTPMRMRRDSLAAAARAALEIRESAIRRGGVATVGRMVSSPGVITAVPGRTEMQLDQRHLEAEDLAMMREDAFVICRTAAEVFGCTMEARHVLSIAPTLFDPMLVEIAGAAVREAGGGTGEPIPSGPLHDATEVRHVVPTAMIFVQSDPPASHAPIEDSPESALRIAIDAYGRAIEQILLRSHEFNLKG